MNWTCPYCGRPTTITQPNYAHSSNTLGTALSRHGHVCVVTKAIACPNIECKELSLHVALCKYRSFQNGDPQPSETILEWNLMPRSAARPWPEYIPIDIRNSYSEACLILNDSPKASAALSRRCLQGIVRDFWQVPESKRGNLGAELSYIKDKLDSDTWDAINAIRSVGDIGAHMEKDVNLIIDVEPREAQLLVSLIETLLDDWYVERHKRTQRNAALKGVAAAKLAEKKKARTLASPSKKIDSDDDASPVE